MDKDLNLERKLSSLKIALYIPFPSFLFGKRRGLCLPEALWSSIFASMGLDHVYEKG